MDTSLPLPELSERTLLRTLLDSLPDPIFLKNAQGSYWRCNAAFEAFVGRLELEIVGRSDQDLFGPDVAAAAAASERTVLDGGALHCGEEWAVYPDGRRVLFEVRRTPLRGPGDAVAGLIGVCRDVTQQRQLEEQLRQASKLEAIGQLAGGVAHDFNNLLTAVVGNLSLVKESLPAGDRNRDLVSASEKAAWRAAELTKQLLGFARRTPLRLEAVDLNAAIAETVAMLQRAIDPRIAIDVIAAPELAPVRADASQVHQILLNLCLNARDAMPQGGWLTIATAAVEVEAGRYARLTIRDTGAGIAPDALEHIFEPFFTTKEPGKGTGLGLAMVHGIVQQHGGWIECTSELGAGTRFDVYLPSPASSPAVSAAPISDLAVRGHETILLADDEPLVRNLGRTVLERQGYRVVCASDGEEAVEAVRRDPAAIDLAILDVTMPRLSGREAARQIHAASATLRILLASGYAADTNSALGEPGVRGFIGKPYRPSELSRAVRAALDG